MDGAIDCASEQSGIEFFREKAFAAGIRKRAVLNDVARGFDDMDRKRGLIDAMGRSENAAQLMGLRQSQRTAAAADLERRDSRFREGKRWSGACCCERSLARP